MLPVHSGRVTLKERPLQRGFWGLGAGMWGCCCIPPAGGLDPLVVMHGDFSAATGKRVRAIGNKERMNGNGKRGQRIDFTSYLTSWTEPVSL